MKKLFASLLLALLAPIALAGGLVLREDTASQVVMVGPFVDTDGAPVTGLTIDAADVRVSKNGANMVAKNSGGCTHDEIGFYACTFDATDTDTAGRFQVMVAETGALVVKMDFQVLPTAPYDRDNAASALGYVPSGAGVVTYGTAQAGASGNIQLAASTSFADNFLNCTTVGLTGGTGAGQWRVIDTWTSSTDTGTVTVNWTTAPSSDSTYVVVGTPCGSEGALVAAVWAASDRTLTALDEDDTAIDLNATATGAAASVTGAVGSVTGAVGSVTGNVGGNVAGTVASVVGAVASVTGAVGSVTGNVGGNVTGSVGSVVGTVGSVTGAVGSVTGAVGSVTGNVGGNVLGTVATVNALAANSVNASALATDAVTEIQSGLATASALATVDGVADDIKAKTDSLTFTVAGQVDANTQSMNGAEVLGDGTSGDKWRGE